MLDVFVSSDEDSIHMGQKWLDRISNGLKTCAIEIVLCSPISISRPWINFEAGAGWVRDIPVIPLCHSGIEPATLPIPLNLLQAAKANEVSSLKLIFPVLAQAIGAKTPNIDFDDFVAKVAKFEIRYTFWDACNSAFAKVNSYDDSIIPALKSGSVVNCELTETEIMHLTKPMEFLAKKNILKFVRGGFVTIGVEGQGMTHSCSFKPLSEFSMVVSNDLFNF